MSTSMIDENVVDFLEHVGVKGMKWGVRRDRRNEVFKRAASGKAGLATKIRAGSRLGPIDLVKGRGVTGGSARRFARISAREERMKSGQAHLKDFVTRYGSSRYTDLVPVRSKNVNKKTFTSNDKLVVVAAGSLFALQVLARQAAKRAAV